ncbi:MAG: tRNA 4-thiouridine(8) synthase ThiI [Kiritimatiellaeota bacterium]|nr:tRNA 4-thiouridine(8) synthase ThiI [Kiritimatiellota bacterium]
MTDSIVDKNSCLFLTGVRHPPGSAGALRPGESSVVNSSSSKPIRALCLLSGGLDSQLAARLLLEQGIAVQGVTFTSIFFGAKAAEQAARQLDVPLLIEDFTSTILAMLAHPKHGFGAGMNPCIDCHIAMVRRSGELMRERGFQLVSTGEVLNQRPMSQHRQALQQVASESGVGDYLLRPLSAKLLPETEPEKRNWVDRARLLAFEGRSRKPQMALARELGITDYPQPAGGCLLTDPAYGKRLKDLKTHEGLDIIPILRLRLGRHFRVGAVRVIVGRNQAENQQLEKERQSAEYLLRPRDIPGPSAILPAGATEDELQQAAEICARYSDFLAGQPVLMEVQGPLGRRMLAILPAMPEMIESRRI